MAEGGGTGQVQRWLSLGATVIAPATLLSTLLFYFGYVCSREQYAYFGIDVDTIGLSTRDYVMRSPQPLLAPLLVLALLGAAGVLVHARLRRRLAAVDQAGDPTRRTRYLARARWAAVAAGAVLVAGLGLLFGYPYLQDWSPYDLVTPLLLGIGAAGLAYVARIRSLLAADSPVTPPDRFVLDLHRGAVLLAVVLVLASAFWATATVAQWTGRGLARHNATRLDRLPSVIVDTEERLYLRSPGIEETALPAESGQHFRYRYRHLRLLVEGHDRMFLVPDAWSASDSTLLLPLDSSVRVQFQFRNDPP
jgi:hypothetical protein